MQRQRTPRLQSVQSLRRLAVIPWPCLCLVLAFVALERHAKMCGYRRALRNSIDVILTQRSAIGALLAQSVRDTPAPSAN
jgi:hypothetical protein